MVSNGTTSEVALPPLDLHEELYQLDDDEKTFFKRQAGIEDDEELKKHIIAVQKEAYEIFPYPCIQAFGFTTSKIARLPAYPGLLKLGQDRDRPIFIDFASCFGNDVRHAISDGFPIEGALATDLREGFWAMGHKLFRSTPQTFPVPFLEGDIFDENFIKAAPPCNERPEGPNPVLAELTSLNPLQGRVDAIHISAFFHLFTEAAQLEAARRLASLLSPEPGSMIMGMHCGQPQKGFRQEEKFEGGLVGTDRMFCHSPESWVELWDGGIFAKGSVRVDAVLDGMDPNALTWDREKYYWLLWCVTRL